MKNDSVKQTKAKVKFMKAKKETTGSLSDNALYLMTLADQLKKLLGPASLQHFLATGETIVFNNKAVG